MNIFKRIFSKIPEFIQQTEIVQYKIGDYVEGGIIIYLDKTKQHGLLCSVVDVVKNIPWSYDYRFEYTLTNNDGLYAGKINTNIIVSKTTINDTYFLYKNDLFAAYYCINYNNKYSDWYLPSKYELSLIYNQKDLINETIEQHEGLKIENDIYWSSTEENKSSAWGQNFKTGDILSYTKTNKFSVRSVRQF